MGYERSVRLSSFVFRPSSVIPSPGRDRLWLAARQGDQLFVALAYRERLERFAVLALGQIAFYQALDVGRRLGGRHPAQDRPADRRVLAEAAAQVDLVRLQLAAVGHAAPGRALEADVGHPVVGAGVGAAVHAQLQAIRLAAEPLLESQDDLLKLGLGLGHREIAERLAGAGHAR